MSNALQITSLRPTGLATTIIKLLLGWMLGAATTGSAHAQGQIASGTVSGSVSGTYTYNLTFSDAGGSTAPIGSIWYAWIPGFFYLPGTPTGALAPSGWNASVVGNSIQFTASSAGSDIAAGHSLSGFSYTATFSPTQLANAANSGLSVAYSSINLSGTGENFTVQAVPEPSAMALMLVGVTGLGLVGRRKLRGRDELYESQN